MDRCEGDTVTEQPPDLDQNGHPIGAAPPDLDASGKPAAAPAQVRSRTGQMYTPPTGSISGDVLSGAASNFDPRNLVALAKGAVNDPIGTAKNVAMTPIRMMGDLVTRPAHTLGQIGGMIATGPAMKAMGGTLQKIAPEAMDMGLQRTSAQRLEFPNTPKRLVDEGIVPRGQNIQNALNATESKVNADASGFDAAHPIGPVDPDTIAQSARDFAHKEGKVGGLGNVPGQESGELDALKKQYQDQNTRSRSLAETLDQKRAYQARSSYSSRPNAPSVTNNELNFNKGVAGANRDTAIQLHPPLAADLAKEQDLIGGLTAQKFAESKSTPLSTVGTAKTIMGLRNPTTMGGAAIGLDRTGRFFSDPRTLRAALLAELLSGGQ